MHKKRNLILIFLIITAVSGSIYYYFKKTDTGNQSWRTAKVERGDIKIEVTATGTLSAITTVLVGTQVSGTISKLFVDFNSHVTKGQIIALLDPTFLAAAVEDAEANVQKGQTAVELAKREYERTKILFKDAVVAPVEYEQKQSAYEMAKSNLQSILAQFTRAKINLQYATIRAPISGVVISRKVDVGQTVAASFNTPTLFTIANDLTKMQVQATIDEADIGQVRVGQNVDFTVDAYPNDSFIGKVSQVRMEPVNIQNVVNYIVIIEVPNPDMKLLPGMTANISVKVEEHLNILKVPASALKLNMEGANNGNSQRESRIQGEKDRNSGKLWILKGDSITPVTVITGLSDGYFAEVDGALKEGDLVVTGINSVDKEASQQNKNPFLPSMRPSSTAAKKK